MSLARFRFVNVLLVAVLLGLLAAPLFDPQPAQAIIGVDDAVEVGVVASAFAYWEESGAMETSFEDVYAAATAVQESPQVVMVGRQVVCAITAAMVAAGEVGGAFQDFGVNDKGNRLTQAYIDGLKRTGNIQALRDAAAQQTESGGMTYSKLRNLFNLVNWSSTMQVTNGTIPGVTIDGVSATSMGKMSDGSLYSADDVLALRILWMHLGPRTAHTNSGGWWYDTYQPEGAPFNSSVVIQCRYNSSGAFNGVMQFANTYGVYSGYCQTFLGSNWRLSSVNGLGAPVAAPGLHKFGNDSEMAPRLAGGGYGVMPTSVANTAASLAPGQLVVPTNGLLYPSEASGPTGVIPKAVVAPGGTSTATPTGAPASPYSMDFGPMMDWLTNPLNSVIALLGQIRDNTLAALANVASFPAAVATDIHNLWVYVTQGQLMTDLQALVVPSTAGQVTQIQTDVSAVQSSATARWPFAILPFLASLGDWGSGSASLVVDFDATHNVPVHIDFGAFLSQYVAPYRPFLVGLVWLLLIGSLVALLRPKVHV